MELDTDTRAARGLRRYVRLVATALDLGAHGYFVQLERPVGLYLAVDGHLPRFPTHDVALTWHEEHGWAAGVETRSGADLLILRYLGREVLPPPRTVARFVHDLFAGRSPGQPDPPAFRHVDDADDLPERLAGYATPARYTLGWIVDGPQTIRADTNNA